MNEQTKSLIEERISNSRTLESIKISDTVHSWLTTLNRVVDICNIVDYPDDNPETASYENVLGFMTSIDKLYLDGVKTGISPLPAMDGIDADIRELNTFTAMKKSTLRTVDSSLAENSGRVKVNRDSIDVQCIDAYSDVIIEVVAWPHSEYYCEKLVSIKAEEDIQIEYAGNNFTFVNNSIYPNVEYSAIGTPRRTILLKGNSIVYRMTFIHSRVLMEVVENTQLLDNYKAPSASRIDPETNGLETFRASETACGSLSGYATHRNGVWQQRLYVTADNGVSEMAGADAVVAFETLVTADPNGTWNRVRLRCEPFIDGTASAAEYVDLESGTHLVELDTIARDAIVRVEYYLNHLEMKLDVISLTVIARDAGRTYDE